MFFPASLASRRARPLEAQPAPSGSAFAVSAALRAHPRLAGDARHASPALSYSPSGVGSVPLLEGPAH
eukprot:8634806-Pyramimonas_sp.AAC.1